MTERNRQMTVRNEILIREIDAVRKDKEALERAAREELGFIKPGEIVFNLE
jgi:cell division protein FtsB